MPPKGTRPAALKARAKRQTKIQRETAHRLNQLDLNTEATSSAAAVSRAGEPRAQSGPVEVVRNYEPVLVFSAIKIDVVLVYGPEFKKLPGVEKIESTIGRTRTIGQIQGLIENNEEMYAKLKETYDITLPTDHKATYIVVTDAAGFRYRADFDARWDSGFSTWAGEVEGGDLPAERRYACGACGGTHGPEIEVVFDNGKVAAALAST